MIRHPPHRSPLLLLLTFTATLGCNENEQVAKVAIDAAERQAEQNQQMAQNTREVTQGSKQLIAADAQSRQELIEMQRDLQDEQSRVGGLRDELEDERREIAAERLTESQLGPLLKSCAAAALCIVTIGFCWVLLHGLRHDDVGQTLSELLVEEFASTDPTLLPRPAPSKNPLPEQDATKRLSPESTHRPAKGANH